MPCGKKPLIKRWDKPKNLRVITPSVLEQTEQKVKVHWQNVIRDLERSYGDEEFWESYCDSVRELVGPKIFHRIAKIFKLPIEATQYEPQSELSSPPPSNMFYVSKSVGGGVPLAVDYSISDFAPSIAPEEVEEEEDDDSKDWSVSSVDSEKLSRKSMARSKSYISKSVSKMLDKSFSKVYSKFLMKTYSSKSRTKSIALISEVDESAASDDDLIVHASLPRRQAHAKRTKNPHFDMLYCNESETDMITWNSKYKHKVFQVSASDEFSKKAEIMTKQIAKDFYDWWVGLGNVEFKSEIKRPEDIEELFQVWFDEHASRGLVLDPKILPCVLQSIANYVGVPKTSCPRVLKRQIASDIYAETSPEHTTAFGTCLPEKMKHIPPKNNTKETWHCLVIPEDLKTMSAVWDDISHLTSTKTFQKWLEMRPHLPMPPCLRKLDAGAGDKKQLFIVPSDYVVRDKSVASVQDLALPVSQFSLELKEVLSKLMNQ